jgi:hypothetical protein
LGDPGIKLPKTISEPRAPNAGVILHLDAVPSLKKGDNIADIGVTVLVDIVLGNILHLLLT